MLDQIKYQSQNGLVLCFVGVGSAFSKKNDNTSLIIAKNGKTILVDAGISVLAALNKKGIDITDFDYYHFTHDHDDHIGSLPNLLYRSRYVTKKKINLIINEPFKSQIWNGSLQACANTERPTLTWEDYANIIEPRQVVAGGYKVDIEGIKLAIIRTKHVPAQSVGWSDSNWSTCLLIDDKVIFTADTKFDPSLICDAEFEETAAIFHDCQLFEPETVHATYSQLNGLKPEIKSKMYLTHYGDTFDKMNPQQDGFAGFAEPWKIYKF